jgi:succinate dehydrogenase / fumarate reductase cytochrome b subunit
MRSTVRPRRPLRAWFDVRRDQVGSWAFALNRLTGLGLTLYLFIHLVVLSLLLRGESGWNEFIALVKSPLFVALDVLLIVGILFHGLNGIRLAFVGMGVAVRHHKRLFWALMVVGIALLAYSLWRILELA